MKFIILLAGKGERLLPLTRNTPKSLLEIRDGVTVLENQLTRIRKSGIKNVVLVTGYLSEQIEAKSKSYEENIGIKIKIIYNPFYASSNNLMSLWFARDEMNEDFTILNGDDLVGENVIPGLLKAPSSQLICMVTDRKKTYDDDDMKIIVKDGIVTSIGKDIPPSKANGESVGMIRILGKGKNMVRKALDEMARDEASKKVFYLKLFQKLADEGWPISEHVIEPDDWAEIDFHSDVIMVKEALEKKTKKIIS